MDRQSTVLPRLTAFGVKFGYLFGVTAATLILVSWIVSNTLLDSAKAARERMQNILSAQRDFHRFSIVSQHLRNFEKQLTRIENVVHSSTEGQVPEHAQRLTDAISYLHWTQVYWADVNDLIEFTFEIERLSKPVSVGDKFKTELKAISTEIWNIQERFQTLRKDYEANQIKLLGQDGISMERTTHEQVDSLQPLIMEYWQSVRKVIAGLLPLENRLLKLSSSLSDKATASAEAAEAWATRAQYGAFCLYFIGSILAIWGKLLEAKRPGVSSDTEIPRTDA